MLIEIETGTAGHYWFVIVSLVFIKLECNNLRFSMCTVVSSDPKLRSCCIYNLCVCMFVAGHSIITVGYVTGKSPWRDIQNWIGYSGKNIVAWKTFVLKRSPMLWKKTVISLHLHQSYALVALKHHCPSFGIEFFQLDMGVGVSSLFLVWKWRRDGCHILYFGLRPLTAEFFFCLRVFFFWLLGIRAFLGLYAKLGEVSVLFLYTNLFSGL